MSSVEQARCGVHPDVAAQGVCKRCGTFSCEACIAPSPTDLVYCRTCGPSALRESYFKRELGLKLLGAIYVFGGVLALLVAGVTVAGITESMLAGQFSLSSPNAPMAAGTVLGCSAVSAFLVVTGWKLRRLVPSARKLAVVPALAALFATPGGTLLALCALGMLFSPTNAYLFTAQYRDVIAATPRRRIWDWAVWPAAFLILQAVGLSIVWKMQG